MILSISKGWFDAIIVVALSVAFWGGYMVVVEPQVGQKSIRDSVWQECEDHVKEIIPSGFGKERARAYKWCVERKDAVGYLKREMKKEARAKVDCEVELHKRNGELKKANSSTHSCETSLDRCSLEINNSYENCNRLCMEVWEIDAEKCMAMCGIGFER